MRGNKIPRILSLALAMVMLLSLFAACGDKSDNPGGGGGKSNAPSQAEELAAALGFVYVPEYFSLPEEAGDAYDMCYHDGMLYFTYYDYSNVVYPEVKPGAISSGGMAVAVGAAISSLIATSGAVPAPTEAPVGADEPATGDEIDPNLEYQGPVISLMRVGIDGTGLEKLAYEPTKLEDGVQGDVSVNRISVDKNGNIWVVENAYAYHNDENGNYVDDGQKFYLRKLDSEGNSVETIDLSYLKDKSESEYFYIGQVFFDKDGNVYVNCETTVFILDANGQYLFDVSVTNWIQGFVTLGDGSIGVLASEGRGMALKSVNIATKSWGKDYELKGDIYNTYPGNADYDFFYNNNSNLFGYKLETGESQKLINWIAADVNSDYINTIVPLDDGRILCTSRDWSGEEAKTELIIFTKKDASEVTMKTSLTLACLWLDQNIKSAILNFNKTNPNYRIDVKDYSEYNDYRSENESDWNAGMTKLTTEIITGNVPDLLMTSGELPMVRYVSKGLLEDIYPYIDSDPDLGRDKLMESVLKAMEIDGGLYEAASSFSVQTVIGRPSDVGTEMGWTIDDLTQLMASKPAGTMAFSYMTRDSILQQSLIMDMQSYVDWETGKCSFDSEDFVKLLEFAKSFPEEIKWDEEEYVSETEMIMSGKLLLMQYYASEFEQFQMYKAMYGGEVTFIGFPSSGGNGAVFGVGSGVAMSSTCRDKEAAWSFMRTLLTSEYQDGNSRWNFPTNRASFDALVEKAMKVETYIDENGEEQEVSKGTWSWGEDLSIEIKATTQAEVDQIMELINSTTSTMRYDSDMMKIVTEDAKPFFAGQKSAKEVAAIIQGRVSTYVNEQM